MNIARSSVLLLALAAAGVVSAAEPGGPAYTEVTVAGVKVGIDRKTGRLRPLTVQESKALDAALREGAAQSALQQRVAMPATAAEAQQTRVPTVGGGTAMKLPLSEMSTIKATRDSNGALRLQHDGEAPAHTGATADE